MHRLSAADFSALARGLGDRPTLARLRRAETSKNLLLIRAVLTEAAREYPEEYRAAGIPAAREMLVAVQSQAPDTAAEIIALPQVGAWAVDCLGRLRGSGDGGRTLAADLGYFNSLAAAAAIRAARPFRLVIPLYGGALRIPTVGIARFSPPPAEDWTEVVGVRSGAGLVVTSDRDPAALVIPAGDPRGDFPGTRPAAATDGLWTAPPRLRSTVGGLTVDVALDDGDPFLDRYTRSRVSELAPDDLACFRQRFGHAWQLLVQHHPEYAGPIAAGVQTVVLLAADASSERTSATSTTAFGAVALSVPRDDLELAETLVHEFQHLKLCAVLDLVPLLGNGSDRPCYAPWRADPRPAGSLLQGAYAYLGVARFWREHRRAARGDQALRAHVEFARWRSQVPAAVDALVGSGRLTAAGLRFARTMRDQLTEWQTDPVPRPAERLADEISMHHRVRWQLQHVPPDRDMIERLATAWAEAAPARPPADHSGAATAASTPAAGAALGAATAGAAAAQESSPLTRMLALRYLDSARYRRWCETGRLDGYPTGGPDLCPGDIALLHEDAAAAVSSYRRQIVAGQRSPESWVGLALAMHRSSRHVPAARALLERTGVLVALHDRLRALTGSSVDPVELASWLADAETEAAETGPADTGRWP